MKRVFVTVGTQCPFPRLVDAMADWAAEHPAVQVFAQTAEEQGDWQALEHVAFCEPVEHRRRFTEADVIVGHVGTGTIVGAMQTGKPIVCMPRRASLGEHRNDHQLATAARFARCAGVHVVENDQELHEALEAALASAETSGVMAPPDAGLIKRLRARIAEAGAQGTPKVLALASGGGHWVQLCRLLEALKHARTVCATTALGDAALAPDADVHRVRDGNRWNKRALLASAWDVWRLVWRVRPDVILTTGAAPGYFALRFGKMLGAKTIWVDSIANAEELSLSGQKAGKYADLWLTQWPELARPEGPAFAGSVLPVFERAEPVRGTGAAPACEQPGRASDVAAQA